MFTRRRRIRESLRPASSRLPELSKSDKQAISWPDISIRILDYRYRVTRIKPGPKVLYEIISRFLCRFGSGQYSGECAHRRIRSRRMRRPPKSRYHRHVLPFQRAARIISSLACEVAYRIDTLDSVPCRAELVAGKNQSGGTTCHL